MSDFTDCDCLRIHANLLRSHTMLCGPHVSAVTRYGLVVELVVALYSAILYECHYAH